LLNNLNPLYTMENFEIETEQLINSLYLTESQKEALIQAIEWEKELSWSNGYADAVDQIDEYVTR